MKKRVVLSAFILMLLATHVELGARDECENKKKSSSQIKQKDKSKKKKRHEERDRSWKMRDDAEYANKKRLEREALKKQTDERRRMRRERRKANEERRREKHHKMVNSIHEKDKAKVTRLHAERKERKALAARWQDFRKVEVKHDYELGRFADLYKQPSRPTYATYIVNKHLFNVGVEYDYAHDAYASRGGNHNITKLTFGENPVLVQDLLLVSKVMVADPTGVNVIPNDSISGAASPNSYLRDLADKEVRFLGKAESWGLHFDLARYLWKRNVVFGIQVPVKYMDHKLKADMSQDLVGKVLSLSQITGAAGVVAAVVNQATPFMQRYGQDTGKFIRDIFQAKGITELGGSTTGLGDITVFAHVNFDSVRVDNLMAGMRFVVPTAQKATTGKLWAPELGNGGFFEGSVFMSAGLFHKWYCNPHLFMEVSAFAPAHVNRRVPKKITATGATAAGLVSFGNRILGVGAFSDFDTTFRGLADNVATIKMTKGQELNVRVGNIIEKFIVRRAFLDLFYDFRAKLADDASGLNRTDWNVDIYKDNTQQVEHKAGFEWSYQFDQASRLRTGAAYTFAGRNVPKTFMARLDMNYSF